MRESGSDMIVGTVTLEKVKCVRKMVKPDLIQWVCR
jgi:hypothetical protein